MRKKASAPSLAVGLLGAALTLVVVAVACTPAPTTTKTPGKSAGACDSASLDACVAAVEAAIDAHEDPSEAVRALAAARSKSGDDGLSRLLTEMEGASNKAFALSIGSAHVESKALSAVALERPLADDGAASARLVYAIGRAAKASRVVAALPDGTMVRAYPSDALAPTALGLLPIVVDRDAVDLDGEAAMEDAIARGAEAGKAFDYVALADAVDAIEAYLASHRDVRAGTLRGRVFSTLVGLAAIRVVDGPPPQPAAAAPEPSDTDTPYYDLLRVRTDGASVEWNKRSARILGALPEDHRASAVSLFAASAPCGFALPPPITTVDDLSYAPLVTRALLPAMARDPQGRVPIETWYPAYTSFVKTVSETDTTYLYAARLVLERGGSAGIIPSGSEAHRIVANLATKHARALEKLATARPGRLGVGLLPFLLAPGTMIDPDLRKATLDLAQAIARGGLGESKNASEVLVSLFTSVLTGFDLPPDLRAAHLGALESVFTAKLRGDFATEVGWGVALLFGIDGAYRVAFDNSPNIAQTAAEITRALEGDATIAQPAAAHLLGAVGRYVTHGLRGELGPAQPKANTMRPERAEAKAALDKAMSELGPAPVGSAPSDDGFVRDVVALCDASLTTLVSAVSEKLQTTPTAPSEPTCPTDVTPLDARTKNALPPLRDLRNKVMANPAWKTPTSPRSKRLKLVVLAISDVLDTLEGNGEHRRAFAVGAEEARAIVREALHDWIGEEALENAMGGAYALARGWAEHGADHLKESGAFDLRTLLGGLGAFLKGDDGNIEGAVLLSMLLPSGDTSKKDDLLTALVHVARSLYEQKKLGEGDMLLLGSVLVSTAGSGRPTAEALELAEKGGRLVGPVMRFWSTIQDVRDGAKTDPGRFEKGLTDAVGAKCAIASVAEVRGTLAAIQDFRDGKRADARKALAAVLDGLAQKGFALPHYKFVFKQETRSRALSLSIEFGLSQGLVGNANAFALGAGAKTDSEPVLSMDEFVTPSDSKEALDEAARYYVHAQAILAAWDFLDGDLDAADLDAAKVVTLLHAPSWLSRPGVTDEPGAWARDSAGALLLLAELAIANGRPFLAGDLLTLVKMSLHAGDDAESLGALLDPTPFGFAGVKEAEALLPSAKATLDLLAANLPCKKGKTKIPALTAPTCGEYARAIALRVADVLPALPKLTAKKGAVDTCPGTAAVDGFLQSADKGVYEPDAFLAAVDAVMNEKKLYDASVMLGRFRRGDHCSKAVFDRLTPLTDRFATVPAVRADLQSVRVNCSTGAAPTELSEALSALDDSLVLVGDAHRSVETVLFAAAASFQLGSWEPLEAVALKKDFLARWESRAPETLFAGLVFDHAATILHGDPVRVEATKPQFDLLCGGAPPPERVPVCRTLEGLRRAGTPDDALKKAAAEAVVALLERSH